MALHPAAVTDRAATAAAERAIPEVVGFAGAIATSADPAILLLAAEGTDPRPLGDWIAAAVPGAPVRTGALEDAGATLTLTVNRVIVAVACGTLLTPATVEAAGSIVGRPAGSYLVALVGAEVLRSVEEMDLVRRGLWRVLFDEPGVSWTGQDLARHGCLLWGGPPADAPDGPVATAVARDVARLGEWLLAPPPPAGVLDALRAEHAVELLERGLARRAATGAPPTAGVPARRRSVRDLRTTAADLHGRVVGRFEADVTAMERQLGASVATLEQDLRAGVEAHLRGLGTAALHGPALEAAVTAYVTDGTRAWRQDAERLAAEGLRRSAEQTDELLDGVDWALVDSVVGAAGRYPDAILDRMRAAAPIDLPESAGVEPGAPRRHGPPWRSTVRGAACGGVCAAAGVAVLAPVLVPAAVLGPVLLPAAAAGVLGAAGGAIVDSRMAATRSLGPAVRWGRAAISVAMGEFAREVRCGLRTATDPVRNGVDSAFGELDAALGAAAAGEPEPAPGGPGPGSDAVVLAQLRADLAASRPDHVRRS